MASFLRELASDSLVYGVAGVFLRLQTFLLVPVYAHLFSPADFGTISLVNAFAAGVSILTILALDNSAHRWYWNAGSSTDDRKRTIATWAWSQFLISVVMAVAICAMAPALNRTMLDVAEGTFYLRCAGLAIPLTVLDLVVTNWLRMQRRAALMASYAVGMGLVNIGITVVLVIGLRMGVRGVFLAQVAGGAVSSVVAGALVARWVRFQDFSGRRWREMISYALPLIPGTLAWWVITYADRYFLQTLADSASVGVYQIGFMVAASVQLLSYGFQQAWGPLAFSIHTQDEAKPFYAAVFSYYVFGASLFCLAISLFSREIVYLVARKDYADAANVVVLLSFSFAASGLSYIAGTGPGIVRKSGVPGFAMAVAAIISLMLNLLLVPLLGRFGSAVASLGAQLFVPLYVFHHSQKCYPIPFAFGSAGKVAVVAFLLAWLGVLLPPQVGWGTCLAGKVLVLTLFVVLCLRAGWVLLPRPQAWVPLLIRRRGE